MKKFYVLVIVMLLVHSNSFGQLNEYKYLIVPTRFDSFKNENQFRTSTFVKYLFTNEGFNVVYENMLPEELKEDRCLGLRVNLINESSLFATKTRLALVDCSGVQIIVSQNGRSKTKEFEQAYREAISESFGTFRGMVYNYEPREEKVEKSETITLNFRNDVKSLDENSQAENLQNSQKEQIPKQSATNPRDDVTISEKTVTDSGESQGKIISKFNEKGVLYAQPIEGGYQLVDTSPKVVYVLKATSAPDVFLVAKDGKNGVVFKNDDKWFIEMDEKGGKAKELNIKF